MYRPSNVRFLKRSSDENIEKFKWPAQLPTPYVNTSGARDDLAWPVLGTAHGEIVEMEIENAISEGFGKVHRNLEVTH